MLPTTRELLATIVVSIPVWWWLDQITPLSPHESAIIVGSVWIGVTIVTRLSVYLRKRFPSSLTTDTNNFPKIILLTVTLTMPPLISGCQSDLIPDTHTVSLNDLMIAGFSGGQNSFSTDISTGRSFLLNGRKEEIGYGYYSYLLLGRKPADTKTRERYLEVLRQYLLIETTKDLRQYIPKRSLNITYAPIKSAPPLDPTAEWLLDHYDYARSESCLRVLAGDYLEGPYILSVPIPIQGTQQLQGDFLYQDFSGFPPKMAGAWINLFLQDVGKVKFGEKDSFRRFALELRGSVSRLTDVTTGVVDATKIFKDAIIKWFPAPSGAQ